MKNKKNIIIVVISLSVLLVGFLFVRSYYYRDIEVEVIESDGNYTILLKSNPRSSFNKGRIYDVWIKESDDSYYKTPLEAWRQKVPEKEKLYAITKDGYYFGLLRELGYSKLYVFTK